MKGLELAREFYFHCLPKLMSSVPDLVSQATFGLAGDGEECFGRDDARSLDRDSGVGFCMWMDDEVLADNKARVEVALSALPPEFKGRPSRFLGRDPGVGAMGAEDFYESYTGLAHPPRSWREWMNIPEERLAAAVNGEIFDSGDNCFVARRKYLLDYYPRDVWMKKLALAAMSMSDAGQNILPRSLERGDSPAAALAVARFAEAALSMVYIFNKRYKPVYYLAPLLARNLPTLGSDLSELLDLLAANPARDARDLDLVEAIENFCSACASHLRALELSEESSAWLAAHGSQILDKIENAQLKAADYSV